LTVYGFVGPSGTGKSHRALELAKRLNVSCILDDGLLIRENIMLAGVSAKREASRIASIRRALYTERAHAESVRAALYSSGAHSVMILGTSVHMVDEIARRLDLPGIEKYINIEDVASSAEINAARNVRANEGKHVIPVPTFALKKEFSGYFLTPLRRFVKRGKKSAAVATGAGAGAGAPSGTPSGTPALDDGERTVVRPTFSYLGGYTISRTAIEQLIYFITAKIGGISKIVGIDVDFTDSGLVIDLSVSVRYGVRIHDTLRSAIEHLRYEIDRQTSLHIRGVTVVAKSLEA